MKWSCRVCNWRYFLDTTPYSGKLVQSYIHRTKSLLSHTRPGSLFLRPDRDSRQVSALCSLPGVCGPLPIWLPCGLKLWGQVRAGRSEVHTALYYATLKPKSRTWNGRAETSLCLTFKSCRFRRFEVGSWGLQGLQAGSLECHFHRHEGSQFTIFFSSVPSFLPLQLAPSGSTRVPIYLEQDFSSQKCSSGYLLSRDWL